MLRNDPAKTWIKPDKTFNSTHPNSQNFLIKGDNLEALKLLKNAYEKKIKMIYIDPPYNTGNNDFVYKDDRKYTPKELSSLCGMSEEECEKMLKYYAGGKNSHSAWLTFMYPRLSLARNLLKEDGVIFISIDDNEQAQLKLLCDEIFGEENFVSCFVCVVAPAGTQSSVFVAQQHNYCLVYAKNRAFLKLFNVLNSDDELKEKYKEQDKNGFYYSERLWKRGVGGRKEDVPSLHFPVFYDEGKDEILIDSEGMGVKNLIKIIPYHTKGVLGRWTWSKEKMIKERHRLIVKKVGNEYVLHKKNYRENDNGKLPHSVILSDIARTEIGSLEVKKLFGDKVFDYPKSTRFIKHILKISTSNSDDIILDFFAGSGTTAQAVMELNAEDGGNRQFILVQLPEVIDEKNKTAYDFVKNTLGKDEPKISDITQERIIRASKQIQEKYPEYQGDLGFQVFELEEIPSELAEIRQSNFEKINHLFANEDIDKMLDIEAILQSFCLYDSIPLGAELEKVDLGGYIAYKFQERIYLLHQGFQTKHLQEFLRKMDDEESFCVGEIVLLAYCFESARRREIAEAISYYNKKSRELKIVVRG